MAMSFVQAYIGFASPYRPLIITIGRIRKEKHVCNIYMRVGSKSPAQPPRHCRYHLGQ